MENDFKTLTNSTFFPLIINYIFTIHGINELIGRGLINEIEKSNVINPNEINNLLVNDRIKDLLKNNPQKTPLLMEQVFSFTYSENPVKVDINEVAGYLINKYDQIEDYLPASAQLLLILAYSLTEDNYKDRSEEWEFFRHIRNASAHGGTFFFKNNEPVRSAKWRTLTIEKSMQNSYLFKTPKHDGLLTLADPILFLTDIEKKFSISI